MGLELVTGYAGGVHITSYQDAMINAGITGMDNAIFGYVGQALKAVVTSANNVRIYDGAGMIGGKVICINKGQYVDVPIANGVSGKKRSDLICVKYTKNSSTGVESIAFQVVQGTAGTSYVDPAVTKNDLFSTGTITSQEKLYRVKINGLAIEAVEPLFETLSSNKDLEKKYAELNSKRPVFKDSLAVNPIFSTDDLLPGVTYSWMLTVYSYLANTGYNQEISCKQDGVDMGTNGDNCHLTSTFMGQCAKGCKISVGSYKTGSSFYVFTSRIVFVPMD